MPIYFAKTDEEFSRLQFKLTDVKAGAQVSFLGKVRAFDQEKEVHFLDYEAHIELAQSLFLELESEVKKRFKIIECIAIHRLDRTEVGQAAVLIEVTSKHRNEAFKACRFLIDELKKQLPIWKKEVFLDGTASWQKNCQHHLGPSLPVTKALFARGLKNQNKNILLVGAGGLGCPLAINLSSLFDLTIYDGDLVEPKNISRQFIFGLNDVGQNKAWLIKKFLGERSASKITAVEKFLTKDEAQKILPNFDLVIDGSDCPHTKKMLKQLCFFNKVPLIVASVYRSEGEVQVYSPKSHSCLSCFELDSFTPIACDAGVFTHVCALVSGIASEKALQLLLGQFEESEMFLIDAQDLSLKRLSLNRDDQCLVCSKKKLVRIK